MTKKRTGYEGHPKRWLSGEKAKTFRRELSLSATSGGSALGNVFTFKFPLAAEPSSEARAELREQYRVVKSIDENALFHFFAAAHLSGFRLFPKKPEAQNWLQDKELRQSAFVREFDGAFGGGFGKKFLTEVTAEFRGENKNADGAEQTIRRRLGMNPSPGNREDDFSRFIRAFCLHAEEQEILGRSADDARKRRDAAAEIAAREAGCRISPPPFPQEYPGTVVWDGGMCEFLKPAVTSAAGLEFAMHQLVSLAARRARGKNGENNEQLEKRIAEFLRSEKDNGLSWLFNPRLGIALFAKTPDEMRAAGIHIGECPPERLAQLRRIAGELAKSGVPCHKFRTLFGGDIGSAVSNYWNRLNELEQGVGNVPDSPPLVQEKLAQLERNYPGVFGGAAARFAEAFAGAGAEESAGANALDELTKEDLLRKKERAQAALAALKGGGETVAGKNEVETVESFNDSFEECRSAAAQLTNVLHMRANEAELPEVKKALVQLTGKTAGAKSKEPRKDLAKKAAEFVLPEFLLSGDNSEDGGRFLRLKINRYRGAKTYDETGVNKKLAEDFERLEALRKTRREHWRQMNGGEKNISGRAIVVQQAKTQKRRNKNLPETRAAVLACRDILQRAAVAVRDCGDATIRQAGMQLFRKRRVFFREKDLAAFFALPGKGRLYVPPFARYRHEPLKLGTKFFNPALHYPKKRVRFLSEATARFVDDFLRWTESLDENREMKAVRDAAALENRVYGLRSSGLSGGISWEAATLNGRALAPENENGLGLNVPPSLRRAFRKGETAAPGNAARLLNLYASEINGLCAKLSRTTVITKLSLRRIRDKALYWLPKAGKEWRPPQQSLHGDNPLAWGWKILQNTPSLFVGGDIQSGAIAAGQLAEAVRVLDNNKKEEGGEEILRACLRQMPHDWRFKADGKTGNYPTLQPKCADKHRPNMNGKLLDGLAEVKQDKNECKVSVKKNKTDCNPLHYIRLKGPSRFKGWLDRALTSGNVTVTFGETSLIAEEEYKQRFDSQTRRPTAECREMRLQAAVVFNVQNHAARGNFPLAKKFIAIDLGERGIGYAVFAVPKNGDNDTLGELNSEKIGFVAVPALRNLMRRVDTHRRKTQPRQRFQSNLNTSLQQMREAAIGELAGVIDALMKKHKAFPVFESSVGGFESGANQIKMVYGSILQLYTYSGTDAHKTKRANHWLALAKAPPKWEHPWLKTDFRQKDGSVRRGKLPLYPGTTVPPAGTSRTCSHCGENPLEIIKNQNGRPPKTDEAGVLRLKEDGRDVAIYIFGAVQKNGRPNAKRRAFHGRRLPSKADVWKFHSFKNWGEVAAHVKDMLRHRALAQSSKDTTQSTYLSPFKNAQKELAETSNAELQKRKMFRLNGLVFMHADANAAVNIGRKWWREKILGEKKTKPEKSARKKRGQADLGV